MTAFRTAVLALALATAAAAAPRTVDLTHTFDHTTIYWPTATPFSLRVVARGAQPGGYWYESNDFAACEHGGTHMDAPCHFAKGRWTVDEVPLGVLSGEAAVIDVSAKAARAADYVATPADIAAFEARHGTIRGGVVLLRTGWGRRWPDRKGYLGTAGLGDTKNLHFPGFGPAAAALLVKKGVKMVGIDTASIDPGTSSTFPCHVIFGTANVPALENLANLDQLPARGARLTALPMKIGGGSGAPVRAIAEVR